MSHGFVGMELYDGSAMRLLSVLENALESVSV